MRLNDLPPTLKLILAILVLAGCRGGVGLATADGGRDTSTADVRPDARSTVDATQDARIAGDLRVDTAPDMSLPLQPGLTAEYFAQYRVGVLTRIEAAIDHSWGDQSPDPAVPADFFSARWTGVLTLPAADTYTFWVDVDDGVRVWVDGQLVIDSWQWQFTAHVEGQLMLPAGEVPIRVEYMERDLAAEVHLGWRTASMADRILGPGELSTTGQPSGLPAPQSPYLNPIIGFDCPDPGVARDPIDGAYYALCTGGPFRIRRSYDLVFWEDTGATVFPSGKPDWAANGGRNWAPEIHRVAGKWVVYFTSVNAANVLSVGAASSDSPTGPYVDRGSPLVEAGQGVIDPNYFLDDDGRHYLTYKIDGNATGQPTPIYLRELAPDGLSFAAGSSPVELIRNDGASWEGGVVEAQWLVKRDGTYYLFYSGNVYDYRYRTGVARAAAITGPYEKHGAPILANNARWVGPGHGSVVVAGGEDVFVYHAWPALPDGTHDGGQGRHVLADRIRWENGWPAIGDGTPSTTPQPAFSF